MPNGSLRMNEFKEAIVTSVCAADSGISGYLVDKIRGQQGRWGDGTSQHIKK